MEYDDRVATCPHEPIVELYSTACPDIALSYER
jgi:hypothetical protein